MFREMFVLLFLLTILTACAASDAVSAVDDAAPVAEVAVAAPPAPAAAPGYALFDAALSGGQREFGLQAPVQRLIIQTATVQLETESFGGTVDNLRDIPIAFGGYTQSERLFTIHQQQQFEIVMRVPAAEFDNALAQIRQIAAVRSLNISAEDVTDQFYDMSSRLETRLIEEERILALIDQTTRLADLLELESRLAATRLQIERYRTSLADLESQITYSTIHVHLFDMEEIYEAVFAISFGERVGGAFGSSIDGTISVIQFIIVVLAGAIIPLAIISPVIILLVFRYRRKATSTLAETG